jgi:lysophospholipase L1-like esterase
MLTNKKNLWRSIMTLPVPPYPETPWTPSPRREDYSWMSRVEWCEKFQKHLQDPARDGTQLVFIGDSITQGWTEVAPDIWSKAFGAMKPLSLGIGGDRTQNLLWRVEQGELAGLNPRVLVLLIGINNVNAGDTPDATAQGIRSVLDRVREKLLATKILILGLLPSGATADDPLRSRIRETNERLARLQGPEVFYADIGSSFLNDDASLNAELMPDFLHPGPAGYRAFANALLPHLAPLFGADIVDVRTIK